MANILNTGNLPGNGQLLTSNGFNGTNWTSAPSYTMGDHVLKVNGNPASLEVTGKMTINGLDLEERLSNIEKVLMIPERDVILESKYPKLKKMYDEYIKELSKARMWETLKGNEND